VSGWLTRLVPAAAVAEPSVPIGEIVHDCRLPGTLPAYSRIKANEEGSVGSLTSKGGRSRVWFLVAMFSLAPVLVPASTGPPDVGNILRLSLDATRADWQHPAQMIEVDRDVDPRDGEATSKTYRVLLIDGTPYDELIARDGKPLPADEAGHQSELVREECAKRANQSADERARRMAKYHHSQQRMFDLMREMTRALDFTFAGDATEGGHSVYVLRATPRSGYQPPNHEARVLTAMQGKLWIDRESHRWVRVEAEVTRPVRFGLFFAEVYPGTRFLLEQAPVAGGVWMPTRFRVQLRSTILLVHKDFTKDETFRDYRLIPPEATQVGSNANFR
jgi:hypothetical protein